ncbi:vesicular, overexpressed in cancer, prosurvival protein 1-like [Chanos chanos]|uniref:WW domain binding protein VOPP1 n=1 Tax=Chanos chanos TaxID=29144 RepID=A0A6J2VCX1_CHACN|nr:vesicular, overexpressed in cancer, prosurvival protein 1-like [Chanos chanos]
MRDISRIIFTFCLFAESIADKKYCWYLEGGYPIYFICKSYEDCCSTRCCVRALSIQKVWYFWVLLMLGILFCCGAGFFIRRRMHTAPLPEQPDINVSYSRYPLTAPGLQQQSGFQGYREPGNVVISPVYQMQSHPPHMTAVYPPLPSYCNQPPPSYEEVLRDSVKK